MDTLSSPSLTPSRRQLWMAAIKPPMYTVAVIPIWVGSAVAWADTQVMHWRTLGAFLGSAIAIIAWLNLTNDVFDADTGIDVNKPHSIVNLTGNKTLIFWIANAFLVLGILGILGIAWEQRDWTVLGLIVLSCFLGYTYQGPPFRLGYQGLGEIICFFTFGPLAITAAYYSQAQTWSGVELWASVFVGITTSLILFCSHFHQVEDDLAAGKRSPIVRLGVETGARWLVWGCAIAFALVGLGIALSLFPLWTGLTFLSGYFAVKLCRFVGANYDQPQIVKTCKFIAVALHFWSGLLFGVGFVVPLLF